MKILIAPDSFKGSLNSIEVGRSLQKGIKTIIKDVDIVTLPIADGGEGTVEAVVNAMNGRYIELNVLGPSGNSIRSRYGVIKDEIAIIEMASASGLTLVKDGVLDAMNTTTFGTGELIKSALENGYKKIYIGIGGSATTDGGIGMAQALGYSFLDKTGKELKFGGKNLSKLSKIDGKNKNKLLDDAEITVLSDVDNPLHGKNGAAHIYGPQKGASYEEILLLDEGLKHYSNCLKEWNQADISDIKGAGAAGGLGAGLVAYCNAEIKPGVEIVLDILGFKELLNGSDLVITGEGKIDSQSQQGKVPVGVAKIAKEQNIPVIAVAGGIGDDINQLFELGIDLILPIVDKPMDLEEAMGEANILLERCGKTIGRIIKFCPKMNIFESIINRKDINEA